MAKREKVYHENFVVDELEPLTINQERYFNAIKHDDIVIAVGSAGTGKTFCAASLVADMYRNKQIRQIIVTRPTVPCGEDMGHLPGNLDEKFDPWIQQVLKPVKRRLSAGKFDCDYGKRIHAMPMQFMRGETFDDAAIIVDEAQNATVDQLKMLCTRAGLNSKIILCGDISQTDLNKGTSGLAWLVKQVQQFDQTIEVINFTLADCVRGDLCKRMLTIFEKADR